MARDMAARLIELHGSGHPDTPRQTPSRPVRPNGEHLVLVNGGEDDQTLIREVAERLQRDHGIGYVLPLALGKDLKSSDISRDLREKLKLCTTMLVIFKEGPEHQVHRRITEFLKVAPQRPKNSPASGLELCESIAAKQAFGYRPPQMRVHRCGGSCAADCARRLAEALT